MAGVILFKAYSDDNNKDKYELLLHEHKFQVVTVSPIEFEFCNLDDLERCISNPNNYNGIIFTSPRCVSAVKQAVQSATLLLTPWAELSTFVIGNSTYDCAFSLGLDGKGKECGNGEELAHFISKESFTKPLLYPVGNLAKDTISNILKKRKIYVDRRIVYKTIPHSELKHNVDHILNDSTRHIVFFSPSGVDSVFQFLSEKVLNSSSLNFYAMGPTTEASLLSHGVQVSGTADKPTPEALLTLLKSR